MLSNEKFHSLTLYQTWPGIENNSGLLFGR